MVQTVSVLHSAAIALTIARTSAPAVGAVGPWWAIASDHDVVQRVFVVPIEYRHVPAGMTLPETIRAEARVTFSGTERAFQFVAPSALLVSVDVSDAATGKEVFTLTESSVRHPPSLSVDRIEPRAIRLRE